MCQTLNEADHTCEQSLLNSFTDMLLDDVFEFYKKDPLRVNEGDEDLFKDPPPREECSICCLPLQVDPSQTMYQSCCGKDICHGCIRQVDVKTDYCLGPFCRAPVLGGRGAHKDYLKRLDRLMNVGDPEAFVQQGSIYQQGWYGVKKTFTKALECYNKGAELGSVKAHHNLGILFWNGDRVKRDMEKAKHHFGIAAMGGDISARMALGHMEFDSAKDRIVNDVPLARACKHFSIAAKSGCEEGMKLLMKMYSHWNRGYKAYFTKGDLEAVLRAHKEAKDAMGSEHRDSVNVERQHFIQTAMREIPSLPGYSS